MKNLLKLIVIVLLCTSFSFTANAQVVRYVSKYGVGNGTSWLLASPDLQAMINASQPGDEVWVAGTLNNNPALAYTPSQYPNYFVMKEGVKIYGGFPSNATNTTTWADRDWQVHKTYLTRGAHPVPSGFPPEQHPGKKHVICNNNGITNAAILDGFYLTDGSSDKGGGINNNNSSPTIRNCRIENCSATSFFDIHVGGGALTGN